MIPAYLIERFGPTLAKVIFWGAIAALLAAVLGVAKCSYDSRAKTEIKLSKGQAGAAVASGSDAVETISNRQAADAAGERTVQETKDEINRARDVSGVTDAGRRGLCNLRAYRGRPECMQRTTP